MPGHGRRSFPGNHLLIGLIACLIVNTSVAAAKAAEETSALRGFEVFVNGWMEKLALVCEENSRGLKLTASKEGFSGEYVCYGPENRFWIKKTESPLTPYLGFLNYPEKRIIKKGRTFREVNLDPGQVASQIPVTEIFRFTEGHWVY